MSVFDKKSKSKTQGVFGAPPPESEDLIGSLGRKMPSELLREGSAFRVRAEGLVFESLCPSCGLEHTVVVHWKEVAAIVLKQNPAALGLQEWQSDIRATGNELDVCMRPPLCCPGCDAPVDVWVSVKACEYVAGQLSVLFGPSTAADVGHQLEDVKLQLLGPAEQDDEVERAQPQLEVAEEADDEEEEEVGDER